MSAVNEFKQFLKTHPQTKYLDAFYCDLSCVIRGKRYPVAEAAKVFESGMMSSGSSFLLAVTGESMDPECASGTLMHSIGGLTDIIAESMGIFAPNINSHDRFVPNMYTPVTASWGFENRSVAIGIPKSPGSVRRIEHRVAGADANPYLTLVAILAGIYHGVTRQIAPGPPSEGNAGEKIDPDIPKKDSRRNISDLSNR